MGRMYNPPHPGEMLREDILPALGLSVTEAANQLGVTRVALSRVLNARAAVIIGDDELAKGVAQLKDFDSGDQREVALERGFHRGFHQGQRVWFAFWSISSTAEIILELIS